ncbi:MAG: oligosaccharide flippase family protein [Paracoccaceae bacterium]
MRVLRNAYSYVLIGNAVSAGMGFAVLMVLTRALDPARFGELAVLINLVDFGLIVIDALLFAGVVVTVSKYAQDHPDKADMALKIGFLLRLPIALVIAVAGQVAAEPLSMLMLGTPDLAGPMRLVCLALPLLTVHSFFITALQSRQRFGSLALATTFKNAFRLALMGGLFMLGRLDVSAAMGAMVIGGALAMGLAMAVAGLGFLRAPGMDWSILREIFDVNKWMAIAAIGLLGARIDIAMLAHYSTAAEAGYYAAALQLCLVITLFSTALVTILLPKSAQMTDPVQVRAHFRKALKWLWVAPVGIVLIVPITPFLVPLALGQDYVSVVGPLNLLVASALLALVCNPALMAHFSLGLVPLYALTVVAQMALRVVANVQVMPQYGATGAAWVDFGVKVVSIAVSLVILWVIVHRRAASGEALQAEAAA